MSSSASALYLFRFSLDGASPGHLTGDFSRTSALAGPRNPYQGKLGVIEEGAYADMLLVDGNPLDNIDLIGHPDASFVLIIKNGTIYKNAVS